MHLVIGAGEFLGDHVARALAFEVPVIQLHADADDDTMADATRGIEVIINCAQTWSPARRLRFRNEPPPLLERVLDVARRAGVRRIVHVSTADVFGSHQVRVTDRSPMKPAHAYERLKLMEERWLVKAAADLDVVIVRPGRVFGEGEDWILPRLMAALVAGRARLPGGGLAAQTFVAASDVGRACLAAADRGAPGRAYLVGGFDSTWRELLDSAARTAGFALPIGSIPYDLEYLKAMLVEARAGSGDAVWPGTYAVDVLGKPHRYDDASGRKELTWSPSVGSFEQEMPLMARWLRRLPEVAAALAKEAKVPSDE